jgi:SAM-dependent methyltransferase
MNNDPFGAAILDYARKQKPEEIVVKSDICEDDFIPVELLFRSLDEMPDLEQKALNLCGASVLDVGAGAGAHAHELLSMGKKVHCLDISEGAVDYMQKTGLKAVKVDFFNFPSSPSYDSVLMLMNGIGIAGTLSNLEKTLSHAKSFLKEGGKIICDSSDIKYLYEDEDGSMWVDLNTDYYGNFRFKMEYKKDKGEWFDWLYVDFDNLFKAAKNVGLKARLVCEENDAYLAELSI